MICNEKDRWKWLKWIQNREWMHRGGKIQSSSWIEIWMFWTSFTLGWVWALLMVEICVESFKLSSIWVLIKSLLLAKPFFLLELRQLSQLFLDNMALKWWKMKRKHKNILHFQFDSMHLGVLHVLFISISVVKYHSQISLKSDHSLEYLTLYIPV